MNLNDAVNIYVGDKLVSRVMVGSQQVWPAASSGFTDNFTRTDAITLGDPWVAHLGTWGITSNQGYVTAANNLEPTASVDVGSADMIVEWELSVTSHGYVYYPFRMADGSNYLFITNSAVFPNRIFLFHRTGGSNTQIGGFTTVAGWAAADNTIRVEAEGTEIRIYINGLLVDTRTGITQHQTATRAGLAGFTGTIADSVRAARWTRFHAEAL